MGQILKIHATLGQRFYSVQAAQEVDTELPPRVSWAAQETDRGTA